MSPTSISPLNSGITTNSIEIVKADASGKELVLGEKIPAQVIEKLGANRYILTLKNFQITATSTVPLNTGEKLNLQVNSLRPQMILNVVEEHVPENNTLNEKLLQWRANPDSLLQVMSKLEDFTNILQGRDIQLEFSSGNITKLLGLFDEIIFSGATKDNPSFLKEFVSKSGLTLESDLKQFLNITGTEKSDQPFTDNIKSLLLKLSSSVENALREVSQLDSPKIAKLMDLLSFTKDALKTIEARQAINTVFQESDKGLALQVPLALAGNMGSADIFIMPGDKKEKKKNKYSSGKVVIFLDLDILGKISANVIINEGSFRCIIKCESEEVTELLACQLDRLRKSIRGCGYNLDYIDCLQESGLESQRQEFLDGQSFSATELVNFFV